MSVFSYFNKWIVNEILHDFDNIEEITYYATVLKLHHIRYIDRIGRTDGRTDGWIAR